MSMKKQPTQGKPRGLTRRQEIFVSEYLLSFNTTQAAIKAGYSERTAHSGGAQLLRNIRVKAAIESQKADRVERLTIETDALVRRWQLQIEANPNDITQHRRVCCRYCWGDNFTYQYKPSEYAQAKRAHEKERMEALALSSQKLDIGEFPTIGGDWYNKRLAINSACPECFGEGVGEVFIADTTKLSGPAQALFEGVTEGRDGIEVRLASKQKAEENLARAAGLYRDKVEVEGSLIVATPQELDEFFEQHMAASAAAAEAVKGRAGRLFVEREV
jgi:phage terminase small subunit